MHIGVMTGVFLDRPLREAAERTHSLGLKWIELPTGGFFPQSHCNPAELLADDSALARFKGTLTEFDLSISALSIHGEPLHPDPDVSGPYDKQFRDTCALAEKLGVTRLTLLAGLPEAAPGDKTPNWILYPFPAYYVERREWQWEERLIPYWKKHGRIAEDHGLRLCFEMHPGDMVFRPEELFRLRDAVGTVIGCNLDPSHLFWQGMDIVEVVRALGDTIYHVHAKDTRVDKHNAAVNGVLEPRPFDDDARTWVFRTVGYGHGEEVWREFVTTLRAVGYDDVLSIEYEDVTMDPDEGLEMALDYLRRIVPSKPAGSVWFEAD
jgi:sugar phosphate isomerase/epimerase